MLTAIDDFIRRSEATEEPDGLFELFAETMRPLGFPAVAYLGYQFGEEIDHSPIVKSNYPAGCVARYTEKERGRIDPVLMGAVRRVLPFTWSMARNSRPPLAHKQRCIFDEAGAFGLRGGAVVPIHGFAGEFAIVCFSSTDEEAHFDALWRKHQHVAHVMSMHLHSRIARALAPHRAPPEPVTLSEREAECLIWMARGKTNWEISEILSLSERTIQTYLENCKRKLGVYTKTQAVVKAIMRGLIKP